MKTIIFTNQAAKDFDSLDEASRETLSGALAEYAINARGDVKRLAGRDGFRLRVGRCRVIFEEDHATILVLYAGKRDTTLYRKN